MYIITRFLDFVNSFYQKNNKTKADNYCKLLPKVHPDIYATYVLIVNEEHAKKIALDRFAVKKQKKQALFKNTKAVDELTINCFLFL